MTKSGFSKVPEKAKIDYFDANLLNRKMVVAKMLTKSGLLTILRLTKSGFHCTTYVPMCAKRKRHSIIQPPISHLVSVDIRMTAVFGTVLMLDKAQRRFECQLGITITSNKANWNSFLSGQKSSIQRGIGRLLGAASPKTTIVRTTPPALPYVVRTTKVNRQREIRPNGYKSEHADWP